MICDRGWRTFVAMVAFLATIPAFAEPPGAPADGPKFDAKSLSQLGPEHLQLVYCGAKASLAQVPEHRKRLDAMAKDPQMNQLFDKKGTAETRRMIDKAAAEAKRIVKDASREYRTKTKKAIGDDPCVAFASATKPGASPLLEACNSRYRMTIAEKLDAEVRSRAVASEFRERFRDKLAADLEQAKKNVAETEATAKAADANFDGSGCRFEGGVSYVPRRAGP